MTSSLWRARGALHRCAGAVLALASIFVFVTPTAQAAPSAPKIVSVDVSGNVHVPTQTILSVVQARPGMPYDPRIVQGDLQRIFALGYFADQAAPLIRQRPGGIAITYRVIENPVITRILFAGNTHVPADTLLALMDTSVGQVLNTGTLRQDFLKINSYYDRIGYGGQLPSHVKNLNIDPRTGALTIDIQEGLVISGVEIGGDPLLPPNVIVPALSAKTGQEYSEQMREQDAQTVQKIYDKYNLLVGDFEGGIDPATIDQKAGTAKVKYDIYVARVGLVQITGNTKTKDQVIRRELYERPGMILSKNGVQRDLERLNNTGFFSKVDVNPKPCPEQMAKTDPGCVVLDWIVTEQKTASASVGAGYSGGLTGQGLYGTVGYSDTNLHGTGNGVSVQFERGARSYVSQAQLTIPYVGNTPASQRYSFGATLFTNGYTYFYPVYTTAVGGAALPSPAPGASPVPIPVTLLPSGNAQLVSGVVSTSTAKSVGASVQVGRRLTDFVTASVGLGVQRVTNSTTVPSPYFFQSSQPNIVVGPTPGPLNNLTNNTGSFGIVATSVANINTGQPYTLNTVTLGLATNPAATLDDIFNPRRGQTVSLAETVSGPFLGSNFRFTQTTLDAAKFLPVLKDSTLGLHGQVRASTGAIPPSNLFTFSDQQLRGYDSVFYGTATVLGQIELRKPLTADRKFGIALFVDEGGYVVRGAEPLLDPYTNRIVGYPGDWAWRGDYGIGLRFDVPQLGLHTIRIDFARGANGMHTSFGIGQSF
ncbi:MAG TPA: POTRA domain-containing protein [Candidatus Baltobacteraceae bacterium]|jgi:outer membrane protein insertion porin family|nr:POTRA domain-containing protein [Candidatus Baltobacteraceae bacterium]